VHDISAASFTGLVDLASATLGGRALATSDDFFAAMDNLLLPGRGEFIEGKYTDRGKWMDGWESRRKRGLDGGGGHGSGHHGPEDAAGGSSGDDHDWCIVELGVPGHVLGFDVDTNHFSGNHPPFASIEGVSARRGTPLEALLGLPWRPLLPQVALRPSSQNLFAAAGGGSGPVSHVRLNIFPDGGVARLRVFGRVEPTWEPPDLDEATRAHLPAGVVPSGQLHDLAAVTSGGRALCCSDAFFGPMNNLLLPGRAANMGGGWETRRKRGPGHDWIIVELGARGTIDLAEVDTNHFKGNFPGRCSIDGIAAAEGARMTDLIGSRAWLELLGQSRLAAHTRHFFGGVLRPHPPLSHVRLNIFPDGGLSRLRLWGRRHA
jgi:allantoicase